jgi:prevent-host-death family protein
MTEIAIADARRNLSDAINRVAYGKSRVVLTRRGRGVAAMIPMEDLELLEAMEDRGDLEEVRRILADPKEKPIPYRKVRKELGLE